MQKEGRHPVALSQVPRTHPNTAMSETKASPENVACLRGCLSTVPAASPLYYLMGKKIWFPNRT